MKYNILNKYLIQMPHILTVKIKVFILSCRVTLQLDTFVIIDAKYLENFYGEATCEYAIL